MKKTKLVQTALDHPDLFTSGELAYFERWLFYKKQAKAAKIKKEKENS
jgi:hypothetical protein